MSLMADIRAPRLRLLSIFVLSYMAAGMAFAATAGNAEFIFYGVVVAAYIGLVLAMDRRVHFSGTVLWALAAWGLLHMAGGLLPIPPGWTMPGLSPVLYNFYPAPWFPKYDKIVHAYGFGVCAVAAWESMNAHFGRRLPVNLPVAAMLLLIATGLGALNEVFEFIAVLTVPDTNVGGYENTCWDLVSNMAGAVAALFWLRWRRGAAAPPV